jgi:predicted acylesterase/phospholipase RssA
MDRSYDALVLSGGGTKGFAMLGVLQYMIDRKILRISDITLFSGSSIGAIIIFFLIIGYSPVEIIVYLCSNNVMESLHVNNFSELLNGVYKYEVIYEHCKNMTMEKIGYIPTLKDLFDNFNKKVYFTTYNLTCFKTEYLSYENYPFLSCLDAIRMSSNLPFIFGEYIYNNNEYIDGGIVDNFPICMLPLTSKVLGIFMTDEKKSVPREQPKNIEVEPKNLMEILIKYIDKAYNILMIPISDREQKKVKTENIDVVSLSLSVKAYKFSLSHSEKLELFSDGYSLAKNKYNKI